MESLERKGRSKKFEATDIAVATVVETGLNKPFEWVPHP